MCIRFGFSQIKGKMIKIENQILSEPLLDKLQVAEKLGFTPRTVDRLMARKLIPYLKIGRSVRFRWSVVLSVLESR